MRSGRERRERSKEGENPEGKDTSEKVEYLPYVDKIIPNTSPVGWQGAFHRNDCRIRYKMKNFAFLLPPFRKLLPQRAKISHKGSQTMWEDEIARLSLRPSPLMRVIIARQLLIVLRDFDSL